MERFHFNLLALMLVDRPLSMDVFFRVARRFVDYSIEAVSWNPAFKIPP